MTPESDQPEPRSDEGGVFGNLPSERPGVRSPRRDDGKRKSQAKGAGKETSGRPTAKPRADSAPASSPRPSARPTPPPPSGSGPAAEPPPRPPRTEAPEPSGGRGVEEVAWAGITVAAEAATLGVRLLSRALEAVRERR